MSAPADHRAYSLKQWALALCLAAVLGWFIVMLPFLIMGGGLVATLLFGVIFGLPVAFVACFFVGGPVLFWRMRQHRPIGRLEAAMWGAVIAGGILLLTSLGVEIYSWSTHLEGTSSRYAVGGEDISVNGRRTAAGWRLLAQQGAGFVVVGIIVALAVFEAVGRGRPRTDQSEVAE